MTYNEITAAAICNRLLRSVRRQYSNLKNAWTDEQGRCCMADGYRAYRLAKTPNGLSVAWTCEAESARVARVDLNRFFQPLEAGNVEEMPAPDADAVKAFIAANTTRQGRKNIFNDAPFDLGKRFPMVNAKYLLDVIRLLPGAKWFVLDDPYKRMVNPIFAVSDDGSALIMPIRSSSKPSSAPKDDHSAGGAPAKTISKGDDKRYFVYMRMPNDSRYYLADLQSGKYRINKLCAPMYKGADLERVKALLDEVAAENPGVSLQLRATDGVRVAYTTAPTFTPEAFAEAFAA